MWVRVAALTVAALAAAAAPTPAQERTATPATAPSFTLEQVLAAPFASELVAAPDGGAVAWVVNENGARNVWAAEAPAWGARRLTSYATDDGQEIGDLAFAGGARPKAVLFVRGGDPNRRGEIPNPTSAGSGARQELLAVPLGGGEPRRLADGGGPVAAPAGDRVYFVRGGEARVVALESGGEDERLFAARGRTGELRLSRDGARLAFVSRRGDHSIVGVYDLAARAIRWLDPGADADSAPAFTADGRSVVYLRQAGGAEPNPFVARREGDPWEIRVADVATGNGRLLWRAPTGRGSVFQALGSRHSLFLAGERVVFPWERDGWLHLYSVALAGGEPVLLTPGAVRGRARGGVGGRRTRPLLVEPGRRSIAATCGRWRPPAARRSP